MQQKQHPAPSIHRPTRLIKYPYPTNLEHERDAIHDVIDIAAHPTLPRHPTSPGAPLAGTLSGGQVTLGGVVALWERAAPHGLDSPFRFSNSPVAKVTLGLLMGIGLLYLVSRFVNIPATMQVLGQNLATPRGIILALLSGLAFLTAFS